MNSATINYDPNLTNSGRMARQTVRLTFAMWEYRKTIDVEVGGNCTGLTVIDTAVESAYLRLEDSEFCRGPVIFLESSEDGSFLECTDDDEKGEDWLKGMLINAEIISIAPDNR